MTEPPDPVPSANGLIVDGRILNTSTIIASTINNHVHLSTQHRERLAITLYELQRRPHEPDFVDRPEIIKATWRRTAERFVKIYLKGGVTA
jgi:hypothetical protein